MSQSAARLSDILRLAKGVPDGMTTEEVVNKIICPQTEALQCRCGRGCS